MPNNLIPYNTARKPKPPVAVLRDESVIVTIWENAAGDNLYLNASIERVFKDKRTGETRSARSFSLRDIRILLKLLSRAKSEMEKRSLNNLK